MVEEEAGGHVGEDLGDGGDDAVDPDAALQVLELERYHVVAEAAREPDEDH